MNTVQLLIIGLLSDLFRVATLAMIWNSLIAPAMKFSPITLFTGLALLLGFLAFSRSTLTAAEHTEEVMLNNFWWSLFVAVLTYFLTSLAGVFM